MHSWWHIGLWDWWYSWGSYARSRPEPYITIGHQKSIKLNKHKLALRVQEVDFMGHLLTAQGLKPDPKKVEAIIKLPTPKSKEDIERLNGTVNYLAKFLLRLSPLMEPLWRLTQTGIEWHWEDGKEKAFSEVKLLVTQALILAYYSPDKELVIQCDASSCGLSAVLQQEGRPLFYSSRVLTDPETWYATTEKEMLAIVIAREKCLWLACSCEDWSQTTGSDFKETTW